jgi:hypothetical protein
VKWIRFTVENAAEPKTRADSMSVGTALAAAVVPLVLIGMPTQIHARESRQEIPAS